MFVFFSCYNYTKKHIHHIILLKLLFCSKIQAFEIKRFFFITLKSKIEKEDYLSYYLKEMIVKMLKSGSVFKKLISKIHFLFLITSSFFLLIREIFNIKTRIVLSRNILRLINFYSKNNCVTINIFNYI